MGRKEAFRNVSCLFWEIWIPNNLSLDPNASLSYPKHAGEADPGPGPPCQSRGQRQRDGGHPGKKEGISRLTEEIHGIPRHAQCFHASSGDGDPWWRSTEGWEGKALVFSLVGLSQSPASALPPSLASTPGPTLSLSYSIVRCLTSASLSCPSWSVVTLFHVGKGGRWVLGFISFSLPSPQMIPPFPLSFSLTLTHTPYSLTTVHPLAQHTSPLFPSTSPLRACSLMSALMSLQFFIGKPPSCFRISTLPSEYLQDSTDAVTQLRGRTNSGKLTGKGCTSWRGTSRKYSWDHHCGVQTLHMHMQSRAHTQRKAMSTYAHNKDHMAVQYSPAVTYCMQGNWHNSSWIPIRNTLWGIPRNQCYTFTYACSRLKR